MGSDGRHVVSLAGKANQRMAQQVVQGKCAIYAERNQWSFGFVRARYSYFHKIQFKKPSGRFRARLVLRCSFWSPIGLKTNVTSIECPWQEPLSYCRGSVELAPASLCSRLHFAEPLFCRFTNMLEKLFAAAIQEFCFVTSGFLQVVGGQLHHMFWPR